MKETEIAYLAGIIDGEGCISICRCNPGKEKHPRKIVRHRLRLSITQKPNDLITWLFEKFPKHGCCHSKNPDGSIHCMAVVWWDNTAGKIIRMVYPYLTCKKAQADIAFEFLEYKENFKTPGSRGLSDDDIKIRDEYKRRLSEEKQRVL